MYELTVEGMSCGGCVKSVTKTVQFLDSAATVDVTLESKSVRIQTTADLPAVTAALEEAGYPVTAGRVA